MKRNSWHYTLAKLVDSRFDSHRCELNIYHYAWLVLVGVFSVLSFVFISSVMVWSFVTTIYETVGAIFGFAKIGETSVVLLWLIGTFAAFVMYAKFMQHRHLRRFNHPETKQTNSFFGNVYKSWKQKFCFYVKFED